MDFKSSLRGGLFIFECFRFTFLMGIMAALRAGAEANFPWMIYAVPNALFLLLTLFLWLNYSRYQVYAPLYISGKVLSVFSILGWFIFSPQSDMAFSGSDSLGGITTLFAGDLLTIIFALLINRKPKPVVENKADYDKIDNTDEGVPQ